MLLSYLLSYGFSGAPSGGAGDIRSKLKSYENQDKTNYKIFKIVFICKWILEHQDVSTKTILMARILSELNSVVVYYIYTNA